MKSHYQTLIVGGGNAGLSAAAQLLHKNPSLQIGIIEPSEKHYYQPAWTLVGAGEFDIKATEKPEANFIPKGTTWIKDAVVTFQPEQKPSNLPKWCDVHLRYHDCSSRYPIRLEENKRIYRYIGQAQRFQ
ncbi:MAG: FAD/NAD(P)-binding oxidoreductase [Spirosomataceae bacterium]